MYQDLVKKNDQPGGRHSDLGSRKSCTPSNGIFSGLGLRLLWGVALMALSGCTGMGHFAHTHVLEHFSPSYLLPYYHCPHCGRVIPRLGHHECCGLDPMVPFYGYNATCWRSWPMDWPGCPVTMETVMSTEPGKPSLPEAYDPTPKQQGMPAFEPQIGPLVPVDPQDPPSPSDLSPSGNEPPPVGPPPPISSPTDVPGAPRESVVPSPPPPATPPSLPPVPAPTFSPGEPALPTLPSVPDERRSTEPAPMLEQPATPDTAPLPEETPAPVAPPTAEPEASVEPRGPALVEDLPNQTDFAPRAAPRPSPVREPDSREPALNNSRSFSAERALTPTMPNAPGPGAEPTTLRIPGVATGTRPEPLAPSSRQPAIRLAPRYQSPELTIGSPVARANPLTPPDSELEANATGDERWRFFGGQGPEMRWTPSKPDVVPGYVPSPSPPPGESPEPNLGPPAIATAVAPLMGLDPSAPVGRAPQATGILRPSVSAGVVRLAPQVPPSQDRPPEQRGVVRLAPVSIVR